MPGQCGSAGFSRRVHMAQEGLIQPDKHCAILIWQVPQPAALPVIAVNPCRG